MENLLNQRNKLIFKLKTHQCREEQTTVKQGIRHIMVKFHYTKDDNPILIVASKIHGVSTENEIQMKSAKMKRRN